MNIALIGPVHPYRGGISHFTARLWASLVKVHRVDVISFSKMYPRFLYPGKSNLDSSNTIIKTPAEFLLNPLNPITWIKTERRIENQKPDLVLIQWWTTFLAPCTWFLSNRLSNAGIPVAFIIHNVLPHESNPIDVYITKRTLASGKGYIVQSQGQFNKLENLIPSTNIHYCPHPVYDQFIDPSISKAAARSKFNINEKDFVLLFFGIVRPYKGLKYLLTAVSILAQQGVQIKVIVAGEFWEKEQDYKKLIADLKLKEIVIIENRYIPNEEISLYFKAADVFIAPYIAGTQSGALKIALSFGLSIIISPIIASDPWMTAQTGACTIVDPQNTTAFSKAIEDVMMNIKSGKLHPSENTYPKPSWDEFVTVIEKVANSIGDI